MQASREIDGRADTPLRILLVEDDIDLARSLAAELGGFGHEIVVVGDGRAALNAMIDDTFDAVILDRLLPGIDGIDILERLRGQNVTVPIIMLTALVRSDEKVEGLVAGADDYVAKPVTAAELEARVRALLRGRQWTTRDADTIRAGDIVVSPTKFRAWRNGKVIDMPTVEFELLAELARNADAVMTRTMLLERVWGYDFNPDARIVDTYIRRLRGKLTADGSDDPITTVRGVGYSLRG